LPQHFTNAALITSLGNWPAQHDSNVRPTP